MGAEGTLSSSKFWDSEKGTKEKYTIDYYLLNPLGFRNLTKALNSIVKAPSSGF